MNSRRNTLIVIGVILLAALLLASWYVFLVRTNTDSGAPSTFSPYTEGVGTAGVGRGGAQSGNAPGSTENTDGGFGTGSGSLTPPSNSSIAEEVKDQRPETPTFTEIETDISGGYSIVPTLDDLYTLYSVDRARGYVYTINPLTK